MTVGGYPRYQPSGIPWVDALPDHWAVKPLLAVGRERDVRNAGMAEDNLLSLSYGRIVRKDMSSNEGLLPESFETYQIVEPDDLVFRLTDLQNDKRSLRTGIVRERGIITSAYLAVEPTNINAAFFSYLLRAYDLTKVFYSMGGGLRQSMKYADVRRLPIIVPPLSEQTAIATFLDRETGKIDALVEEQKRLIELLKEKRRAVISHAVTKGLDPNVPMKSSGVEWLGDVPGHWSVATVGTRYEVQLGRMLNEERARGEHLRPYLRVADVQWGTINTDDLPLMDFPPDARQRYRLRASDLLVNEGGSYVGRSAIWRGQLDECYYQKALHRLRPQSVEDTTEFFYFVMEMATQRGVFIAEGNQTTIDHLTAEQLRKKRFAFPPFYEQVAIAEYLNVELTRADAIIESAEVAVGLLQERRAALISAAVAGKIDVRHLHQNEGEVA